MEQSFSLGVLVPANIYCRVTTFLFFYGKNPQKRRFISKTKKRWFLGELLKRPVEHPVSADGESEHESVCVISKIKMNVECSAGKLSIQHGHSEFIVEAKVLCTFSKYPFPSSDPFSRVTPSVSRGGCLQTANSTKPYARRTCRYKL